MFLSLSNTNLEIFVFLRTSMIYPICPDYFFLWYIDITARASVIHEIFPKKKQIFLRNFFCILQCAICFPRFLVHNFNWKANKEEKCINKYNDQICTLFEKVFNLFHFLKTFTSFFALFLREKTGFVSNSSSEKCHGKIWRF